MKIVRLVVFGGYRARRRWAGIGPGLADPQRHRGGADPGRRRQRHHRPRGVRAGWQAGRADLRDRIGPGPVVRSAPAWSPRPRRTAIPFWSMARLRRPTHFMRNCLYDTVADFTPVVPFGETPLVVVTAVGRYNTLAEPIAAAKAKPGELNYSTVGIGSAAHFGAVRLAVKAGITAQHIPFKGPEWADRHDRGARRLQQPPASPSSALSVTASLRRSRSAQRSGLPRCQTCRR